MNIPEIGKMLLFASTLDYRINNEPDTVIAWSIVLDEGIDAEWAMRFVRNHYKKSQAVLTPSAIDSAWRNSMASVPVALDGHCGRSGCVCGHRVCYRGWIDSDTSTTPCGVCRPRLAGLIETLPPLAERRPHDSNILLNGEWAK